MFQSALDCLITTGAGCVAVLLLLHAATHTLKPNRDD
jgi:hypothetical protein